MKQTNAMKWMTAAALLLWCGAATAHAQYQGVSLGDYARSVRKNKPDTSAPSRHYDNDNLPTSEKLSVVGPEPSSAPDAAKTTAPAADSDQAKADRQKANVELQKQIDDQKQKIESLSKELDLEQREYRLRVAQYYTDPNNRLQNSLKWDEQNKQYQADAETKQKALDSAREQLDDLQKKAREAGIEQKESDKDTTKDESKDDSNKK